MKITKRLLQSEAEKQGTLLSEVKYIDLSCHGIANIEHLETGGSIQTLDLGGNNISIVENLALCHQLWHVDISCNDVSNLFTLSRFIALGYLNLSFNNISWNELMKIRHMHILELCLHGNTNLEKDPNYRVHVIDCIPCVWMLDGRQVTAAERVQVQEFFQQSALSRHPVRKKLTQEQFIPSSLKKLQTEGTYGIRTVHLMMRFPKVGALNVATDRRRLQYLAYNLQEDLKVVYQSRQSKFPPLPIPNFESLLEARVENADQCNVLLLLLVTFLDFRLPFDLLQETITCAQLDMLCETDVRLLFALPKSFVCRLAAILLSAIKIDRDDRQETGLYEKLYLSLHYTVDELTRSISRKPKKSIDRPNNRYKDLRALLGCEVIQLFCIVPEFFNMLTSHGSVSELVNFSSGDGAAMEMVRDLIERIYSEGGNEQRVVEEVADFLVNKVQKRTKKLLGKQMIPDMTSSYSFVLKKTSPRRPQSSSIHSSLYMSVGRPSPKRNISISRPGTAAPIVNAITPPWRPERQPRLGDKVLLGRQNLSFILALPEYDVALIQMENIPAPNSSVISFTKGTDQNYSYLDLSQFVWDWKYSYWKPVGTTGDRITLHEDGSQELAAVGTNPPAIDEESPRDAIGEEDEDTTIHPSPRDSLEDFPVPMSVLVREKLKLSSTVESPATKLFNHNELRLKLDNNDDDDHGKDKSEGDVDGEEASHVESETEKGLLYDCIKCAMDSVRENNKNVTSDTTENNHRTFHEERKTIATPEPTRQESPDQPSGISEGIPPKSPSASERSPRHNHRHINLDLSPETLAKSSSEEKQFRPVTRQRPKSSYHQRSKLSPCSSGGPARPSTASGSRHRGPSGSPIMIQMGNFWLAGGRDVNLQSRVENFKKTQHTPGWMEGASKRPKSVGPRQQRRDKSLLQRRAKSAGTRREPDLWVGVSSSSNQPPPSPASSDTCSVTLERASPLLEPDYLVQSRQQNFPGYPSSPLPSPGRPNTPPYGAPKRPASPLEMTVK